MVTDSFSITGSKINYDEHANEDMRLEMAENLAIYIDTERMKLQKPLHLWWLFYVWFNVCKKP